MLANLFVSDEGTINFRYFCLIFCFIVIFVFGNSPLFTEKKITEKELLIKSYFPSNKQEEKGIFLARPDGIDLDEDDNIWVVDSKINKIIKFSLDGDFLGSYGRTGEGPSEFIRPSAISCNKNIIAVKDSGNSKVLIFDKDGIFISSFKYFKSFTGMFLNSNYLYTDVFAGGGLIRVLDLKGGEITSFGNKIEYSNKSYALNNIFMKMNNEDNIVTQWEYFPIMRIYSKKGVILKEIHIQSEDLIERAKENLNVSSNAGVKNKIRLLNLISGLFINDKEIYLLSQHASVIKIYKFNYEGELCDIYYLLNEHTPIMISGLVIKGSGKDIRIFISEQYPTARIYELKLK